MKEIPDWLFLEEAYEPAKDREGFLQKTILTILSALKKIRAPKEYGKQSKIAPVLRIAGAVFVILLLSLSRQAEFLGGVLLYLLIRLAFFNGKTIIRILKSSSGAFAFSLVILLPSVLMGNMTSWVLIPLKVFMSVTMLGILSETIPWNRMTGGLKILRIPDVVIFTFDITMKYIVLLGEICFTMLQALKIRSIGKNPSKANSISAILGVTFLKSKEMSEEMYLAMECRGFDGHYAVGKQKGNLIADCLYLGCLLLVLLAFYLLQKIGG